MSFTAVIGIIFLNQKYQGVNKIPAADIKSSPLKGTPSFKKEDKIWKPFLYIRKNYLEPSVGATIGVFPIIIFFMGQINLLSVIGNLFVLPIVPFVMIYGFISVFLFQLLHRQRILLIEKCLILYIYKVSELSSTFGLFLSADGWVKRVLLLGFLTWFIWKQVVTPHQGERK